MFCSIIHLSGSPALLFRKKTSSGPLSWFWLLCFLLLATKGLGEERRAGDDFSPNYHFSDSFYPDTNCPFDCKNDSKCISIFGGAGFACMCVEPYWGKECEFNGLVDPCTLDCGSIDTASPREGSFCVESPSSDVDDDNLSYDQTCVHCVEISEKDEPSCDELIECKNGGSCKIDYEFLYTTSTTSENNEATSNRPLKCSSATLLQLNNVTDIAPHAVWTDLAPYKLSCKCPPGFQGKHCEEIDVCGGCQNGGYCVSRDTFSDKFDIDELMNIVTDDSMVDDHTFDVDSNNNDPAPTTFSDENCTCTSGGCDQTLCKSGASCMGGMCNQDYLVSPMCSGGKCSQRHSTNATCTGGDCDQTSAIGATCTGTDCFHDDANAQTIPPDTSTMVPDFEAFCLCEYGYFGDQCQHEMTTICLFPDTDYNQFVHEFCSNSGGFCPFDVGDRFCANEGTCDDIDDIVMTTNADANFVFSCDCPSDFEGVHCESAKREAPSVEPTALGPKDTSSALLYQSAARILLFITIAIPYVLLQNYFP